MSRVLFAAARGARIQRLMQCPYRWESYLLVAPLRASSEDRIHPDDEHLAYGPVSTALREMAEDPKYNSSWEHFLANSAANEFTEYFDCRDGEPDYPLFYLILAEYLADSGL
jgi:hypothetical protein